MPSLIGHAAIADALLNLWLALSCFDFYRFIETGRSTPLRRAFVWIGLGLLTKGPVAAVLPIASVGLFLLIERRWDRLRRLALAVDGGLIAVLIALIWVAPLCLRDHGEFLRHFLIDHNVARYSRTLQGHGGHLWYYLLWLPIVLMPFTPVLLRALPRPGQSLPALERYLWIWLAVAFVFFSCSGTQLPHYILYGCAGVFVLIGLRAPSLANRWAPLLPAIVLLAVFVALPWVLPRIPPPSGHPFAAGILQRAQDSFDVSYYAVTGAALLAAAALLLIRPWPVWKALVAAGALQTAVVAFAVAPVLGRAQQQPVQDAARMARAHQARVVSFETFLPSFSVYYGAPTPNRLPAPGEWVFVNLDRLEDLQHAVAGGPLVVMLREGGIGLYLRPASP
jgi:4-amino-4-deoxy-L-arabinose transferase-like glycosyltransferase